ncbi:MAG: FtsW/RodA/SpoVE family cell cycle protein [Patescibacteria group bacterium]
MFSISRYFKKFDWLLFAAIILLFLIGLLTIYSINENADFFKKQLIWGGIGIAMFFLTGFIDYRIFKDHSIMVIFLYIIIVVLLILLLAVNFKIRGAASWFRIINFNFQPAEFAKLILVFLLAKYFSIRHIEMYKIKHIIISGIYVGIPGFLIFIQPDLGMATVLFILWFGIIMITGIKPYHFGIILGSGAIAAIMGWFLILKDYQKARILFYLRPDIDPLGHGYNLIQSLVSIGSAGFWGKGLGRGSQALLGFLPEAHTDFIFASFIEEWGGLGMIFLILLLSFILYRMIRIFLFSSNNFARLCVTGICLIIFSQVVINIGMNVGFFPITGLTFPFLSYGGSSLLASFITMGFLESIRIHS